MTGGVQPRQELVFPWLAKTRTEIRAPHTDDSIHSCCLGKANFLGNIKKSKTKKKTVNRTGHTEYAYYEFIGREGKYRKKSYTNI